MQLQQDVDFQHWGVDFAAVQHKAQELGINLIRRPVNASQHHLSESAFTATVMTCRVPA